MDEPRRFYCRDPETGELTPLDSYPVEDLGNGWHRQGCYIYADFGELDLGIVREAAGQDFASADAPPSGNDPHAP